MSQSTPEQQFDLAHVAGPRDILVACVISAVTAALPTISPFLVGALKGLWSVPVDAAGHLLSLYFIGSTLGTLVSFYLLTRWVWRFVVMAGVAFFVGGLAAAALSAGVVSWLMASFGIAGFGAGILFNIGIAIAARAREPERAFGYKLFADMLLGSMLIYALPLTVIPTQGVFGLLALLAALGLVPLLTVPWIRRIAAAPQKAAGGGGRTHPWFWVALAAVLAFQATLVGMWVYSEQLAVDAALGPANTATVYIGATIATLLGSIAPGLLGERIGRQAPYVAALIGVGFGCLALSFGKLEFLPFFTAMAVVNFAAPFVAVYMFGTTSALDTSGRYVPALGTAIMFAFAIGSAVYGVVAASYGVGAVFVMTAVVTVLATACFVWAPPSQSNASTPSIGAARRGH